MLQLKIKGIDIDLLYAQIQFENIPENLDIMDNKIIEENKSVKSIYALTGILKNKLIKL